MHPCSHAISTPSAFYLHGTCLHALTVQSLQISRHASGLLLGAIWNSLG